MRDISVVKVFVVEMVVDNKIYVSHVDVVESFEVFTSQQESLCRKMRKLAPVEILEIVYNLEICRGNQFEAFFVVFCQFFIHKNLYVVLWERMKYGIDICGDEVLIPAPHKS